MALVLLILLLNPTASQNTNNCVFTDTSGSGYMLDLRRFDNITIDYHDITPYDYHWLYSPCGDRVNCSNNYGMQTAQEEHPQYGCFIVARWDDTIQPQYNESTQEWTFAYENGDNCFGTPRWMTYIWKCNPDIADYQIISLTQQRTCEYVMIIESSIACKLTTSTTTQQPINQCLWTANNGQNRLDLTNIAGNIYTRNSDDDPSQIYRISPCGNAITCNDTDVMSSIIENNNNFECIKNLGIWQNGINEPYYNSNFKSWQFVYENGNQCDGFDSIITVYWNCNEFAGEETITTARQIAPCQFLMNIESKYACD